MGAPLRRGPFVSLTLICHEIIMRAFHFALMDKEPGLSKYPLIPVETIRQVLLPMFRANRYLCIDVIPAERVSQNDPNYNKYKCRTNWFNSSLNGIDACMGQITDPLFSELEEGIQFFRTQVDWQAMRTREEIDRMNVMLEKVILYFDSESGR